MFFKGNREVLLNPFKYMSSISKEFNEKQFLIPTLNLAEHALRKTKSD